MNAYKKQCNLCTSLRRKKMERHFENLTFEDQSGNRSFWKVIKLYLTNNGKVSNDNFILYKNSENDENEKKTNKKTKTKTRKTMKTMLPKY